MNEDTYAYRRWRRWVDMLLGEFGYDMPTLVEMLGTSEAVILGTENPGSDLWRLRARVKRLIGLPRPVAPVTSPTESSSARAEPTPTGVEYQGHEVVTAATVGRSRMDDPIGDTLSRRQRRHLRPF